MVGPSAGGNKACVRTAPLPPTSLLLIYTSSVLSSLRSPSLHKVFPLALYQPASLVLNKISRCDLRASGLASSRWGLFFIEPPSGEVHPSNPYLTVWPSGLRRWLQAPVRKGVGSNPTAVICASLSTSTAQLLPRSERRAKPLSDSLAEWSKALA